MEHPPHPSDELRPNSTTEVHGVITATMSRAPAQQRCHTYDRSSRAFSEFTRGTPSAILDFEDDEYQMPIIPQTSNYPRLNVTSTARCGTSTTVHHSNAVLSLLISLVLMFSPRALFQQYLSRSSTFGVGRTAQTLETPPGGAATVPSPAIHIQVLSDLHLEFARNHGNPAYVYDFPVRAEILALLGDIGLTFDDRLFDWLRSQLKRFKLVFFLSGNHEAYLSSIVSHLLTTRNISNERLADGLRMYSRIASGRVEPPPSGIR